MNEPVDRPPIDYRQVGAGAAGYRLAVAGLLGVLAAGLWAGHYMGTRGHHVTGMTNQVVWGLPHVVALFLVVAAPGALGAASLASVFGRTAYRPLARLSALLAPALLLGGLAVLVLDLGRPDRLAVALTHYNFTSVFAWNVLLYTGFLAVAVGYLWALTEEPRRGRHEHALGLLALLWRVALSAATGSVFAVLVSRQAFEGGLLIPLFVADSFVFGLGVFAAVLLFVAHRTGSGLGEGLARRLRRLVAVYALVALALGVAHLLTRLYAPEHRGLLRFLLLEGGVYPVLFWLGQVGAGALLPVAAGFWPARAGSPRLLAAAAAGVVLGGLAQLYVLVVGGQAWPLEIFPGKEVVDSAFFDGAVAAYRPRWPEWLLGLGGVALALLVVAFGVRVLPIVPASLAEPAEPSR